MQLEASRIEHYEILLPFLLNLRSLKIWYCTCYQPCTC